MRNRWETDIRRDGMWPTRWSWHVWGPDYTLRSGYSFTKDRARRAAVKAKLSMQRDDVRVVDA